MSKQKFNKIVQNHYNVSVEDREKLEQLAGEYPYSQALHTLIAKAHHDAGSNNASQTLQFAAIYATDRSILREIIMDKQSVEASDDESGKTILTDLETLKRSREAYEKMLEEDTPIPSRPEPKVTVTENKKSSKSSVTKKKSLAGENPKKRTKSKVTDSEKKTVTPPKTKTSGTQKGKTTGIKKVTSSDKKATTTPDKDAPSKPKRGRPAGKKGVDTGDKPQPKKKSSKSSGTSKKTTPTKSGRTSEGNKKKTVVTNKTGEITADKKEPEQKITGSKPKTAEDDPDLLIEDFIRKEPSMINRPVEFTPNQQDLSIESTRFNEDLISENLALIMLNQGKKSKAMEIYKKLIWKFPQKKAYFAARIEELNNQG